MEKNSSKNPNQIGQRAERQAKRYLEQQGLTTLACNYRCKLGEIDLIMRDQRQIIFVEVKYRSQTTFGLAQEFVTHSKQQKLIKAAQHFLLQHKALQQQPCRFDVLAGQRRDNSINWQWIKQAFYN